jgi:hypothetical protein
MNQAEGGSLIRNDAGLSYIAKQITLKAFANFSPGLCFGNPGKSAFPFIEDATLKELRRRSQTAKQAQLLQSCNKLTVFALLPRVSRQTLG